MERHVTNSDIVTAGIDALRHDMYHCYPGTVSAYDPGTETASLQVMTNDVRFDVDTGARFAEPTSLVGIPIAWPRFGGFVIKGQLAVNDPVILVAFDLDPTSALAAGRSLKPVDPADVRRHGAGYWWALPTNITTGHAQGGVTGTLTIGAEGQAPCLVINGSTIQLGTTGGDYLALASLVDQAVATIVAAFNGHTHMYSPGPSAPVPTASPTAPITPAPGSVASALVAAQ